MPLWWEPGTEWLRPVTLYITWATLLCNHIWWQTFCLNLTARKYLSLEIMTVAIRKAEVRTNGLKPILMLVSLPCKLRRTWRSAIRMFSYITFRAGLTLNQSKNTTASVLSIQAAGWFMGMFTTGGRFLDGRSM